MNTDTQIYRENLRQRRPPVVASCACGKMEPFPLASPDAPERFVAAYTAHRRAWPDPQIQHKPSFDVTYDMSSSS